MRQLYWYLIVDPEKGEVTKEGRLVAANDEVAKMRVAVDAALSEDDLDNCDIIIQKLGAVRNKKVSRKKAAADPEDGA